MQPDLPFRPALERRRRMVSMAACVALAAGAALAQAAPGSSASVTVSGCVIDADSYSPVGVPVSAYLLDGVALGVAWTTQDGRFTVSVPGSSGVFLMTSSGPRSVHSTATVDTRDRNVEIPGCLLHFN